MGQAIAGFGHRKILIVTDSIISKLGLLKDLTDEVSARAVPSSWYLTRSPPDAPIPLIERGITFFRDNDCDAIVAFGGGSSMDASKAIAVSVANPPSRLRQLADLPQGLAQPHQDLRRAHHGRYRLGSDGSRRHFRPASHKKLVMVDPRMVPKMAALDLRS